VILTEGTDTLAVLLRISLVADVVFELLQGWEY